MGCVLNLFSSSSAWQRAPTTQTFRELSKPPKDVNPTVQRKTPLPDSRSSQKRTFAVQSGVSAKGQKRTLHFEAEIAIDSTGLARLQDSLWLYIAFYAALNCTVKAWKGGSHQRSIVTTLVEF